MAESALQADSTVQVTATVSNILRDLMAKEMQRHLQEQIRAQQKRATETPGELQELDARIARLRERLKKGDADLTADELQTAIERVEAKRRGTGATAACRQGLRQGAHALAEGDRALSQANRCRAPGGCAGSAQGAGVLARLVQ
jgi:hypothetical protein